MIMKIVKFLVLKVCDHEEDGCLSILCFLFVLYLQASLCFGVSSVSLSLSLSLSVDNVKFFVFWLSEKNAFSFFHLVSWML